MYSALRRPDGRLRTEVHVGPQEFDVARARRLAALHVGLTDEAGTETDGRATSEGPTPHRGSLVHEREATP